MSEGVVYACATAISSVGLKSQSYLDIMNDRMIVREASRNLTEFLSSY